MPRRSPVGLTELASLPTLTWAARDTLREVRSWLAETRGLVLKPAARVVPSTQGVPFLGFLIDRGRLRLGKRRRRRFVAGLRRWERAWAAGQITERQLQAGLEATVAITAHADALAWRRAVLARRAIGGG